MLSVLVPGSMALICHRKTVFELCTHSAQLQRPSNRHVQAIRGTKSSNSQRTRPLRLSWQSKMNTLRQRPPKMCSR